MGSLVLMGVLSVTGQISGARHVHHPEPVSQSALLQVAEPTIWDVLEAAITE